MLFIANEYVHAAAGVSALTSAIGVCSSVPNSVESFRVAAPAPAPAPAPALAPISAPTVPYVVVTRYTARSCQGPISDARNYIIGACTAVPDSAGFVVVSVSGSVRHDECDAIHCIQVVYAQRK